MSKAASQCPRCGSETLIKPSREEHRSFGIFQISKPVKCAQCRLVWQPPLGKIRLIVGLIGSVITGLFGILFLTLVFDLQGNPAQRRPGSGELLFALAMACGFLLLAFYGARTCWKGLRQRQKLASHPALKAQSQRESMASPNTTLVGEALPPVIGAPDFANDIDSSRFRYIEAQCGEEDIRFLSGSFFRRVRGPGSVAFGRDEMRIGVRVGLNQIALLISMVPAFFLMALIWRNTGWDPGKTFGVTALVFGLAVKVMTERNVLVIRRENLGKVTCDGPLVTIKFSRSPVPTLREVKFFVCRRRRNEFFKKFEGVFPGVFAPPRNLQAPEANPAT